MIKKLLLGVIVYSLFLTAHGAYAFSDNGCVSNTGFNSITGQPCSTLDTTPRIMYWWGKVNQHVDSFGNWQTDNDGTSGASLDKLAYCRKFFPNTTSVLPYKSETINTWHEAGNINNWTATIMSDQCMMGSPSTPSITVLSPNSGEVFMQGQPNSITWKNGNGITEIGLVSADATLSNNLTILGWINTNVAPGITGITWDGKTMTDLSQTVTWPVLPGKYKIIAVGGTLDNLGNYCTWSSNYNCNADISDASFTIQAPRTVSLDSTPRIAYWYGKVNQHVDTQGNWLTDPDGISGANIDKFTYCRKWYPNTTSVKDYQMETITGWRERGNVGGPYTFAVMTTQCVQETITPSVTILSPNGGEVFQVGQQMTVRWTSTGFSPSALVTIDLSVHTSTGYQNTFLMSYNGLVNDGSETFAIPANVPVASNYAMHIIVAEPSGSANAVDISDRDFTIQSQSPTSCNRSGQPSITVLSPNGGEIYMGGQQVTVKWKSCNIPSNALIRINLNQLLSDGTQGMAGLIPDTVNDGSENITLPTKAFTGPGTVHWPDMVYGKNFRMWVGWNNGSLSFPEDFSDNLFTIQDPSTSTCTINSFTANPMNIPSGSTSNLEWSTTGCAMIGIFVGTDFISSNGPANGTLTTGALAQTTTFTLFAGTPYAGCASFQGYSTLDGQPCITGAQMATVTVGILTRRLPTEMFSTGNTSSPIFNRTLKLGLRGEDVKDLQRLLGITADGVYGRGTAVKVKEWQLSHGLKADGSFGAQSRALLK